MHRRRLWLTDMWVSKRQILRRIAWLARGTYTPVESSWGMKADIESNVMLLLSPYVKHRPLPFLSARCCLDVSS